MFKRFVKLVVIFGCVCVYMGIGTVAVGMDKEKNDSSLSLSFPEFVHQKYIMSDEDWKKSFELVAPRIAFLVDSKESEVLDEVQLSIFTLDDPVIFHSLARFCSEAQNFSSSVTTAVSGLFSLFYRASVEFSKTHYEDLTSIMNGLQGLELKTKKVPFSLDDDDFSFLDQFSELLPLEEW